jgi:hypothetical protein
MPASSLTQRLANLDRLNQSLTSHCPSDAARMNSSQRLATTLPLSHAADLGKLKVILESKALLSQVQVGKPLRKAESILETADDVFLYIGAFSYPGTECGFLFVPSVELGRRDDAIATPFDSGALVSGKGITPPSPYTDGVAYVRDHELPVSDFRGLLARVIADYSADPSAYLNEPGEFVCSCGVEREHPFGLSGGDRRAGSFEVRLPQRVPLLPPHLRAVFVRKGYELPELSSLFASGVSIERYEADSTDPDFFHALRFACISFIQEHLIP